jgi:hypothetical protein
VIDPTEYFSKLSKKIKWIIDLNVTVISKRKHRRKSYDGLTQRFFLVATVVFLI